MINLQSYLFIDEDDDADDDKAVKVKKSKEIKDAIKLANEFQCSTCNHKGPL